MFRRLRNFLGQPRPRRKLLVETTAELLRAWWLVRRHPFNAYAATLGQTRPGEFEASHDMALAPLRDFRWALKRVNQLARGRFTCLMLAIAAKRMLDRRGMANTLVLGVRPDKGADDDPFGAHAWLRAGPHIVIGQEERAGHIPVVSYHSSPDAGVSSAA